MKNKKSLAVLVILAIILIVSCGSIFASGKDENSGAVQGGDEITLKVWSWLSNDHENGAASYDEIFSNFEEDNPNITIEYTAMPYPTFWDSWRNATIAGVGPDVVSMYGGSTSGAYARSLVPLQDNVSEEVISDLKFVGSSYSPDGNLYLLPTGAYTYCLMVNNTILDQVGLDSSTAFATWEDLLESSRILSDAGIRPFSIGWSDGYALEGFVYVFLTQLLDDQKFEQWVTGKLPITDEAFHDALQYVLEMNQAGCFSEDSVGKTLYYDCYEEMVAGSAAAMIVAGIYYPTEAEKVHGEGSISLIPFPQANKSNYDQISDAGPNAGWSVSAWTKQKEAAVKLVEHMASPESQLILWNNTQAVPNNISLNIQSDIRLDSEYLDIIAEENNRTTFMAFTDPALAIFQREASNLITGRTSIEEILFQADQAHQRALSEMFK